ncbi:MAG: hypothetical protein NT117_06345 [Gammaproteobacteria bacterium]|nr:hypothetical protein [Gammaproteobacteria bacterium]
MQKMPYDPDAFSRDVIARWGHLSDGLAYDDGLLHLQMGHLGVLCVTRPGSAKAILHFLAEIAERPDADSEIREAITNAFLDWGDLREAGLHRTVPPQLSSVIRG